MKKELEVLLARVGVNDALQRNAALPIERGLADGHALLHLAAGAPQVLGELLRDAGRIDAVVVREALQEQSATGERFGELLVRHGLLTPKERDVALEFQQLQRDTAHSSSALRLGEILVSCGMLSRARLDEALARQAASGRRLGEEILAAGDIDSLALDRALALQRKLVAVALGLALSMACAPAQGAATEGAAKGKASVDLVIRIPVMVHLSPISQADRVSVTASDIANGFVEVPSGSRFEMVSNTPYSLHFGGKGAWFQSVRVTGLPQALHLGPAGGDYLQPVRSAHPVAHDLSFRFELSPDARPGHYPWPVSLSATAL